MNILFFYNLNTDLILIPNSIHLEHEKAHQK